MEILIIFSCQSNWLINHHKWMMMKLNAKFQPEIKNFFSCSLHIHTQKFAKVIDFLCTLYFDLRTFFFWNKIVQQSRASPLYFENLLIIVIFIFLFFFYFDQDIYLYIYTATTNDDDNNDDCFFSHLIKKNNQIKSIRQWWMYESNIFNVEIVNKKKEKKDCLHLVIKIHTLPLFFIFSIFTSSLPLIYHTNTHTTHTHTFNVYIYCLSNIYLQGILMYK